MFAADPPPLASPPAPACQDSVSVLDIVYPLSCPLGTCSKHPQGLRKGLFDDQQDLTMDAARTSLSSQLMRQTLGERRWKSWRASPESPLKAVIFF